MKVKSLKQVLHLAFLAIGVVSLIFLAFSVSTYLDYAREGYGLELTVTEAWLNDDWLVIKMYIDNPGGFDINLDGGNITLSQDYAIPHGTLPNGQPQKFPIDVLEAGTNTTVLLWVPIDGADLQGMRDTGRAVIGLDLEITVPDRYVKTHLIWDPAEMEVAP